MSPSKLFMDSLEKVQSKSIQAWAIKNQAIWLQIAESAIKAGKRDSDYFAAYIVAVAMGM